MDEISPPERGVRIARLIAARGLASRREAEQWIAEGRVSVNGHVIESPAITVDPSTDHVRVDGRRLPDEPQKVYLLMYKPKGTITGRDDPRGRPSVLDLVQDLRVRVEPVGRLDFDTEGALLLTNDGDLAHKLTHPSSQVPRRYLAKVWRTPTPETLERIQRGVMLEDGRSGPCKARVMEGTDKGNAWVEITVTEGRNRLVRRLLAAVNHPVAKLRRESFATISLRGMERGQVRPLTTEEVARLHEIASGKRPTQAGRGFKRKAGFAIAKPRKPRIGARTLDARKPRVKR